MAEGRVKKQGFPWTFQTPDITEVWVSLARPDLAAAVRGCSNEAPAWGNGLCFADLREVNKAERRDSGAISDRDTIFISRVSPPV